MPPQSKNIRRYSVRTVVGILIAVVFLTSTQIIEAAAPTVVTGAATSITKTSAILAGSITSNGGELITDTGFEFGLTDSYGQIIPSTDNTTEYVSEFGTSGSGNGQFANPFDIDIDSAGNIYVVEQDGSRVQKFNPAGVYQMKFGSFGVGDGQFQQSRGIGVDSAGNIYVADTSRVQKFNSAGVYQSQLVGSFSDPTDIGIDSSDNVYVVNFGGHEIDIYNSAGVFQNTVGSLGTGDGQFSNPMYIAFDSIGNFFVTDFGNHRVQKFNSAGVYQSQFGSDGDDNNGDGDGEFSYIRGIAINSNDDIYVSDISQNRVQKFNSAGVYLSQFGTSGNDDGEFSGAYDVAIDSLDAIYVTDSQNNRVQKFIEQFSADLNAVLPTLTCGTTYHYRAYATNATATSYGDDETFTTLACEEYIVRTGLASSATTTTVSLAGTHEGEGSLNITGRGFNYGLTDSYGSSVSETGDLFIDKFGSAGGGGGNGTFQFLASVGTDVDGNIYTTDQFEDVIQKFDADGNFVSQYNVSFPAPGGLSLPFSVRGAPDGKLYAIDAYNSQIVRFDNSLFANPTVFAAGGGVSFPTGVGFDSDSNVYIADYGNDRIAKFNPAGTLLSTISAGSGGGNGQLSGPSAVAVDTDGNIYVLDTNNMRVQKFSSAGTYVAQVGSAGSGNGEFGISYQSSIAVDADNFVYVVDTSNNRVQKFNSNLVYQSQFGVSGAGDGEFSGPTGIAIGANGDIVIADVGNSRVQIFNEHFALGVTGLICGTTYHYQATATGPDGTETGDDATLTTSVCPVAASSGGGGSSGTHFICTDSSAVNYTKDIGDGRVNNDICKYKQVNVPTTELACETPLYLTRPVKFGASNNPDDVRLLEKYLNTYEDSNLTVDGFYSKADFDTVVRWQEKYSSEILTPWGITEGTGYVFITSLRKIKHIHESKCAEGGYVTASEACYLYDQVLKRGMNSGFVKFAQKALLASGNLAGTADGVFGSVTELAVKNFQAKNGLASDGVIGPTTGNLLSGVKCDI